MGAALGFYVPDPHLRALLRRLLYRSTITPTTATPSPSTEYTGLPDITLPGKMLSPCRIHTIPIRMSTMPTTKPNHLIADCPLVIYLTRYHAGRQWRLWHWGAQRRRIIRHLDHLPISSLKRRAEEGMVRCRRGHRCSPGNPMTLPTFAVEALTLPRWRLQSSSRTFGDRRSQADAPVPRRPSG